MDKLNMFVNKLEFDDLDNEAKELFTELQNNAEVYTELISQGLKNDDIYNNIGELYDYIEHLNIRKKIKCYDDCLKYNYFYDYFYKKNNYGIEKVFVPNKYYQKHLDYIAHFAIKSFDDEFNEIGFKNLDSDKIKEYFKNSLINKNSMYVYGPKRSGKSFKIIVYTNEYIKKYNDATVAFLDSHSFLDNMASIYFKDRPDFEELLAKYKNLDLIIFDNFGNENKNTIIRDCVLGPIISYRASNNKQTIFISNYSRDEVIEMYNLKNNHGNKNINNIIGISLKALTPKKDNIHFQNSLY